MERRIQEFQADLARAADALKQDLQGIRSGRPTTQLLENIQVNVYEQTLTIKELGSLSVKPPREIDITVWDQNAISAVAKAIQEAKAGLTPSVEGNVIRCFLPPLTEERRRELAKLVGKMAEETRIKIRAHRDEMNKKIKAAESNKEINEDQAFKAKEKIQKTVDEVNRHIEGLVSSKLEELRE